ncbi:hypothetical protein D9758_013108 [Tetrapyrgos nigripes]|uniref:Zn(2)-C6 fungal-type domain-containing protein n=1 Tax=Tetrapyrgos nigripes TaxID=182062 RepID=A0A8H5CA43_9AGAR|nr:hypothetical protein D9758_013108 [Tetrapyrgos nigripes]
MPKSASPKKAPGAPKAKGQKCDERADELNRCETCVRLRLQCLGFGAKRPDWLRENNNVSEIREKIKNFLASQGMIKGHSGTGPRAAEQEQTLLLADEQYHPSSESPQSNILVLSEDSPRGPLSNMRELPESEPEPSLYSSSSYAGPSSTYDSPSHSSIYSPSNTLLRPSTPEHYHQPNPYETYPSADFILTSNNSGLVVPFWTNVYNLEIPQDAYDDDSDIQQYSPLNLAFSTSVIPDMAQPLLEHYMQTVYRHQFQLADMISLPKIIFEPVLKYGTASEAAILLADIHRQKVSNDQLLLVRDGPVKDRYDELVQSFAHRGHYDESDAMAALHVISAFLFDGGRGDWHRWMHVAFYYCQSILDNRQRFRSYRDALVSCTTQENFIIKTFLWFDVLASVSTTKPPLFQNVINEIYNPEQISGIEDPSDVYTEPALSMINYMGCENRVLWALSEISALACWKQKQQDKGQLSVGELIRRANSLHEALAPRTGFHQQPHSSLSTDGIETQPEEPARYFASEIFRTAAIAYLQTIVNNDYCEVPEVQQAVKDCVEAFKSFKEHKSDVRHIVVRSTVFAVFLCGSFTDVAEDWKALKQHLEDEGEMGNCKGVMGLIEEVREKRERVRHQPVMWRQALNAVQMLLV